MFRAVWSVSDSDDIVISGDIPLASRCLKMGAMVLGKTGLPFDEDNIGDVLSIRDLLHDLRDQGMITSGPRPFVKGPYKIPAGIG